MHKSNLVHMKKYFSTSNYNTEYWTVFPIPSQEETPSVNLVLQWASLNNLSPSNCVLSIQLPARYSYSSSFSTPWRQKIAIIHWETPQPEESSFPQWQKRFLATALHLNCIRKFISFSWQQNLLSTDFSTSRLFLLNRHDYHCITDSKTHHVLGCCASETVHIKSTVNNRCGNCLTSFAFWHHTPH